MVLYKMNGTKPINLILWVILVTLSTVILKWPVNYRYEYEAVQALSAINHVFILGIVFTAWIACLFILARQTGFAGNALLVCIFGLVIGGFFVINCPYITTSSFDPSGLAYTKYIMEHGRFILGDPQWGYFEFPATPILGAFITHLTGLSVVIASKIILVAACILLPLAAYVFYFKFLGKSFMSFFGTVIAMLGSVQMIVLDQYRPGTIGFLFLAPFLVLIGLNNDRIKGNSTQLILILLLLVTVIMTHFISSVAFIFMLVGIYIYQKLIKQEIFSGKVIIVTLVFALTWWAYLSLFTTQYVGNRFMIFLSDPYSVSLVFALSKAQALLGGQVPLWASSIRSFWILALFALPCLIALIKLVSIRRRIQKVEIELGIILGILLLTIVMTLADQGGNRSIQTFFLFATFLMPLIILRILNTERVGLLTTRFHRISNSLILTVLTCLIVILAFPTFLANNPSVDSQLTYNIEYATFSFLENKLGSFGQVNLFGDADTLYSNQYFLEEATTYIVPLPAGGTVENKDEFFTQLQNYLESFNKVRDGLFIYSPRITHDAYMTLGISEQDPIWDEVTNTLEYDDKIYENGFDSVTINQH